MNELPDAVERVAREFAVDVAVEVSELPDRTSRDVWPYAMLVTASELTGIIESRFAATLAAMPSKTPAEYERGYFDGETKWAEAVDAKDAEIARLREALQLADAALSGANMNMNVVERKVKSALKGQADDPA